jgi:cysteinyl-tRNA synthetase
MDCEAVANEFSDYPEVARSIKAFGDAMDDDFNTPIAIAALFDLATIINKESEPLLRKQLARLMRALAASLGLLARAPTAYAQSGVTVALDPSQIEALIAERRAAKAGRDFARADQIRADLLAQGIVLEDSAAGTTWRAQ